MDTETRQCTNCKVFRVMESFVGKQGVVVKRCLKCREKDARQKKKPDVKEKRNARQKEKQYYKAHREKKRSEDEEAYLKRNSECMKSWRAKNKDHLAKWRTNNVNYRLKGIKQQAKLKGYTWSEDMDEEACVAMMTSPCFYCEYKSEESVNGIDRMDNTKGYVKENCVGCCKRCNFIKKSLDAHTFVERCVHISSCHGDGTIYHASAWPQTGPALYSAYRKRAEAKGLDFELSKEDFDGISEKECHYCKRQCEAGSGIDRVDNGRGYTIDNVIPCCSECNAMRTLLSLDDFVTGCKRVAARAGQLEMPPMPRCYHVITKRGTAV